MGLGNSIVSAIFGVLKEAFGGLLDMIMDLSLIPLLQLKDPTRSAPALEAWQSSFEIAVGILPVFIAMGVFSRLTADQGEGSFWELGFRVALAIMFIAVSKPVIGLSVDFTNAIVMELAPQHINFQFAPDSSDPFGKFISSGVTVVLGMTTVSIMLLGVLLSSILLLFRQFLIYTVFVASPILAVFWVVDWGFMETVQEFSNKLTRMGVYTLLSGILIAIALRVFNVVLSGGFITGGGTDLGEVVIQTAGVMMVPFMLVAITWKSIEWAGEPMGVGQAMNGVVMAGAVAAGGVAGGAMSGSTAASGAQAGQAAGGNVGAGSGGGGGASSGGGGGGGGDGSAVPAATDSQSMVGESAAETGGGLSQKVRSTASDAVESGTNRMGSLAEKSGTQGAGIGGLDNVRPEKLREEAASTESRAVSNMAERHQQVEEMAGAIDGGEGDLDVADPDQMRQLDGVDLAGEEVDIQQAHEAGLIHEDTPHQSAGTATVDEDGTIEFPTASGDTETAEIEETFEWALDDYKMNGEDFHEDMESAQTTRQRANRLEKTKNAGKWAAGKQAKAAKVGVMAATAGMAPRAAFGAQRAYSGFSTSAYEPSSQEGIPEDMPDADGEASQTNAEKNPPRPYSVDNVETVSADQFGEGDPGSYVDERIATEGTYRSLDESDRAPDNAQNYGYIESPDGETSVPMVDFDSTNPDLEDGEQISVVGAQGAEYPTDHNRAHPNSGDWEIGDSGEYFQIYGASGVEVQQDTPVEEVRDDLQAREAASDQGPGKEALRGKHDFVEGLPGDVQMSEPEPADADDLRRAFDDGSGTSATPGSAASESSGSSQTGGDQSFNDTDEGSDENADDGNPLEEIFGNDEE